MTEREYALSTSLAGLQLAERAVRDATTFPMTKADNEDLCQACRALSRCIGRRYRAIRTRESGAWWYRPGHKDEEG